MYYDVGGNKSIKGYCPYLYCTMGEHLTVHKVDWLGEETFLVPGCPGMCSSELPTRWQKLKKGMTWM